MAGVGYGVTPMSRLSQHSSRRRPHTGKPLDLSSPNTLSKKKAPKRKTLSSRYTAVLPSKRRKLGVSTIRDPVNLLEESHQAPEAHHVAVSPKACNASEVSFKEKETRRPSTRGRACKTKARARGANVRVKASRGLKAELCPVAKLLDSKEISNEEALSVESLKPDLFHFNDSTEVGFLPDGNLNGASISSLSGHVNSKVGLRSSETNGAAGAAPIARKNDLESMHAELRQSTEKHVISNKGPGRKSSKRFSSLESPGAGLRPLKAPEAACLNNETNPSLLSGFQVQDVPNQDVVDRSSLLQDPLQLEGSFLRPRRKAKKKSKLEEHRLPPWDYVGKRVVVYWPHAKAWYAGKVIMYDDISKKHKIKYDDNDEECISFRRHKVILEKAPSTQSAVNNKGVLSPQKVQFLEEEVAPRKTVQGDNAKDRCVLEDNALLSAFAPRHRAREGSHETLCNGSVMPTDAVKGLDVTPSNNIPRHKLSKKSLPLAARDHTGGPATGVKGTGGGKEAFVYVRRTKGRRKVDVSSTDKPTDGRIREATLAVQQEIPRKRKNGQSFFQQTAQPEFSDYKFYDNESSCLDAPAACGSNENGSNALDRASRKRNKRSLKKLVSQAPSILNAELAQESEPRQDQLRKQRARRTRRKLARKQKLNNAVYTARNRRLPTKRVLCLEDDVEGLPSASILYHDAAKLYNHEVPAGHMFMHKSNSLFACTIHLVLPVVIPDLFTWQLFSILTCTHFCGGGSFDETFSFNGSMRDWMGVFRIVVRIIKAIPLSAYMYGRQWQCLILHELWTSLPRCEPAQTDALASLPFEIETLLMEHLLDASVSCKMTSREILNLFVCYFIKPYIFATICEKGISIQVAVQRFLVRPRSQDGGTSCLRQSLKHFPLQFSSGSADKGFASYLRLFPRSADWCTEEGVFLKQMQVWTTTTERAGFAESWSPIVAVKKLELGWQVISTCLVSGGKAMDKLEQKISSKSEVLKLEQESTKAGYLNEFHLNCLSNVEVRNSSFAFSKHGLPSDPYNGCCLNSALLFTASLQKLLSKAVGKDLGSSAVSFRPLAGSLQPLGKASGKDEQFEQTQLIGQLRSASEDASEVKISAALPNLGTENDTAYSCFWMSSRIVNAPRKHVKMEPDSNFSRRDSSITTESNNAGIKEESSVEMYERQQPLSSFLLKPDLVGQAHAGVHVKTDEQHFSGQMDQAYYDNKFSKGVKMVKKSRPRYRSERQRPLFKERPTYFCIADLVFLDTNECAQRELGARVELQSKADSSFLISVHAAGKLFEQKIVEGGMLAKNPCELTWKSKNGWVLYFTDREQWELFRCMYNELSSQALRATCVKEIPIPVVLEVEAYYGDSQARSSLRPFFAIKSPGDEIEAAYRTGRVLYDLDSEDEAWMAETSRVNGNESISDGTLERIIDRLEKEAHRRGEATVAVHDAIEFCQDLAGPDTVRAVHLYWSTKRLAKGMSLLRYFQPPLWEQYQDELRAWENRMQQFSPDSQSRLQDRYSRPIMSAFCLQSRTFDPSDNGKRILRQRSQRKIRPTSRSSSEDSHRPPPYHNDDSTWDLTHHSKHTYSTIQRNQHLDDDQEDEGLPESAKSARAKAFEARRVAETRALKLQRRFLEFDSSLQKAWALLIEYTVSGGDMSAQSEALEGRMTRLFNRCSSLFCKGDDSSEDEPPSHSSHVCEDIGDEFLEAFAKKCSLDGRVFLCNSQDKALGIDFEDASPLLPIFVKGSSYAWNGSSLL